MADDSSADWRLDLKPVHLRSDGSTARGAGPAAAGGSPASADLRQLLEELKLTVDDIARRITVIETALTSEPLLRRPPRPLRAALGDGATEPSAGGIRSAFERTTRILQADLDPPTPDADPANVEES